MTEDNCDSSLSAPPRFGLHQLLCEQSRDLYDAVVRFDDELGELRDAVVSPHLCEVVEEMSVAFREAAADLARVCEILGTPPDGVPCEAMKGLVRECKDSSSDWEDSATRDAALIANAQRVAHYGIAGYGTGLAFSRCLRLGEAEKLFRKHLQRCVALDAHLSKLAVGGWFSPGINDEAARQFHSPQSILR